MQPAKHLGEARHAVWRPLPGFRDFYPDDLAIRNCIFGKWRDVARRYGFQEYDGPPLEPLELYTKKSGEEIVGQLYHFKDKGDRDVALRPEMTPTLARMVGAHHRDYKKPMKWFAIPQLFRYERQQRGRLREHFQFNADILGESSAMADAELIALLIDSLRALGLTEKDFVVRIGDREIWHGALERFDIPPQAHAAVFQAIDKIERQPAEKTDAALRAAGLTIQQIANVLEFVKMGESMRTPLADALAAQGLTPFVKTDFSIVRGLAYYTGVVFEAHDRKGELRAIAGGGRYDDLIKKVAGVDLPAAGFGMGDVVLMELLKDRGLLPKAESRLDCFVILVDEALEAEALALISELRGAGLAVDWALGATKVGKQFELAAAARAKFVVVVAPEESKQGNVKVKTMATGQEEAVPRAEIAQRLRR